VIAQTVQRLALLVRVAVSVLVGARVLSVRHTDRYWGQPGLIPSGYRGKVVRAEVKNKCI
jgi:hypothetical protein